MKIITKGTIAICGKGSLGLITQDEKVGDAYIGIHLTDKISKIGAPWQSKNPERIGHTDLLENMVTIKRKLDKNPQLVSKILSAAGLKNSK
jgi:hypothetical protein